ncbi:putative pentatricopeptide repeat-containing protein At3g01580 [Salvia splendens]|uniref:putative pentatricopeptide repeat-containing protein At3g01580 n=1 Tax=Salvia splendens TaxID=180675 RepID=UPI001C26AC50|nr:putative pentatricopeptide repeat-containing protein At3g01580 [Salvia splendens]XP_042052770.1 putative pentatricopeptide repeat-containing protein At3g01580 [Salvia splendens]XP_042052771.1 putative pentatricopeptide repeat-containing protein At3g01580 [Salvia splendens]
MSNVIRPRSAHQVFDKITNIRPPRQSSTNYNAHKPAYRQRPNLVDAFDYFEQNDIIKSWTSRISSLVRENRSREAVDVFKLMLFNEKRPNFVTVLSVLKAAGSLGSKDLTSGIHAYSMKMGLIESQVAVATALVGIYSTWDMPSAWKIFDQTPKRDLVLCSAMVSAVVSNGEYLESFKLLKEMVLTGVEPNPVTFSSVLPACAELGALWLGREIHGYSIKRSFDNHIVLLNSILDMYSKCRHLEAAIDVFEHMQNKDVISWRIIIRGCVENERPRKALKIFLELLACCVQNVDERIIQEVFGAYKQLDENYCRHGFHSLVLKMGFTSNVPLVTELLQLYAKFGDIESARNVFDHLKWKDVIAWSTMASVYAQSAQPYMAFGILREMQLAEQNPNYFTYVSLLLACSSLEALEIAQTMHAQIIKYGYSANAYLTSALIDLYCKFGEIGKAEAIFDENTTKDFICWSSMINGYAVNGCGELVLECFSNMLCNGITPNDVVFVSVLSACSHCGLEYEGWNWFNGMEAMYGIKPNLAHYACMVDMLSRRGSIEEALEFVNNMPMEPDKRIWGSLLAGCRNSHGPNGILEDVAKKLISLDPTNSSYYIILSNLYADQGRWKEVEKLRNMMDTKSLKKVVGYSAMN